MTAKHSDRRGFLAGALATCMALLARPLRAAKAKKVALPFAKLEKLHEVGGSMVLKLKGHEVMLVRDSKESVRAFDPTCTHEKCRVAFTRETKRFDCGCHRSSYDIDGHVLRGPAPKPLLRFPSELRGDRVVITLPVEAE